MPLVVRRESFGAIVGDSDGYGFNVVNQAGLSLLRSLANDGVNKVDSDRGSEPAVRSFLKVLQQHSWIDDGGRFRARFLDNQNDVPFLSAPIRVWLEITSRCNLSCEQCFNENHQQYFTPDMPFEEIAKIIDDLHSAAVLQITVTGGEPLIRRDVFSILDLIVERQFGLRFFTNGASLTSRTAERLSRYPISHLFLSLDGVGSINDVLRGKGTFRRITRGLEHLASRLPNITLSTTLHRHSVEGIDEIFELAKRYGVRSLLIRPLFQYRGRDTAMFIPPGELNQFLAALELASVKYNIEYQVNKLPFRPLEKQVYIHDHPKDVHFSYFNSYNTFGCVGGNTVVGVKANGVIMACGFLPHPYPVEGNSVIEKTFLELWNTSANVKVLRDLPGNTVCKNCNLLRVCGGGCRANALLHTGDINAVDPYCYWLNSAPSSITVPPAPRQYADGMDPYISDRAIITKCGSGSDL